MIVDCVIRADRGNAGWTVRDIIDTVMETNGDLSKGQARRQVDIIREENKDKLTAVLTYHVVPGNYPASSLAGQKGSLATAQGGNLKVDGTNGVKINGANVINPDVAASNGVIHAIDKVLLPK